MIHYYATLLLIALSISTFNAADLKAQSDIKINNIKFNHLDKQKRKQGDWIFFDKDGNVRLSCVFKDDSCISPQIFYENSDTAFVRIPRTDSAESFILYKHKQRYYGTFIHTSDTTSYIEIDPEPTPTDEVISMIKKYQYVSISPVYFFSQKKLIDYTSAGFTSSNFTFNKSLFTVLTISSSGIVTKVEFPKNKNNLSGDEERELHWIYSTMPRWQPFFYKNKTHSIKISLTNNASLSVLSFDH